MSRRWAYWMGGASLAVIVGGAALLAYWRTREARQYSQPHSVRTYGGTNYVVAIQQTTIGRTETGYVLLLTVRLTNPNPFPVRLDRQMFVLADHDKDFYLPTVEGAASRWIDLPAGGVLEKETLSYVVPPDSFDGVVAVQLGHQYWTLVKEVGDYTENLAPGQFRSFRRRHW